MRFFICGGGCYGTFYLRQLDRARARGALKVDEIVVVDQDPDCQAIELISQTQNARIVVADWCEFGAEVFANEAEWRGDAWVPAPIAPHIAYEWISGRLARLGFEPTRTRVEKELKMPFCMTLDNGSLAMSHAPGLCPTNCIEPVKCPLTGSDRDWEMRDSVLLEAGLAPSDVAIFQCRHLSFGVGVIPFSEIYDGARELCDAAAKGTRELGVATVSACHGLLDVIGLPG
ncbi:MAG: hypothetical protein ACJAYU_000997 [Bradymonadia bacterium]|jgi:hypothetical protein